jgi:hypothetical protein
MPFPVAVPPWTSISATWTQGWPRYREHMAAADPELYRVQEHAIQAFLRELDQRHGGARKQRSVRPR